MVQPHFAVFGRKKQIIQCYIQSSINKNAGEEATKDFQLVEKFILKLKGLIIQIKFCPMCSKQHLEWHCLPRNINWKLSNLIRSFTFLVPFTQRLLSTL